MRHFNVFIATIILTGFALVPAAASADDLDDLDVTMEVINDLASVGELIATMEGPGDDDVDDGDDGDDDSEDESDDDGEDGDHEAGESDHDSDEESELGR